ncbi:MAG: MFS transporter, partial [Armatimonadetes bacterium]|nr:MFS transporter [Armatimonadota bacterium]
MALSAGLGLVAAIEIPARQAFLVDMVEDRADLPNAIALNSSLFNGARLLGPVLAGYCVYKWGEGICFLLNAISYLAVIAALLRMTTKPHERQSRYPSVLQGFKEGVSYALTFEPVFLMLLLIATVSLVSMPYQVLMPRFATASLQVDARGFSYLTAAGGFGALCGALYLAQRRSVRGLGRLVPSATWVFGVGLILLGFCRQLWLALLLMAVVGSGMMVQMASANTVLQTVVSDDKRGRLMSLHVMAFMGTAPFGRLLAGSVAEHDLSMWALFMRADIIVKFVMIALIGASFWCWAIIFDKLMRLRALWLRAEQFEESFWSGGSLEELYDRIGARPLDPMSAIFVAAMREWRRSAAKGLNDRETTRVSLPQRIDRVMHVTLGREMDILEGAYLQLARRVDHRQVHELDSRQTGGGHDGKLFVAERLDRV